MADDAPPAAADESAPAAAAPAASIAKVLQSQGPVVTCVLLRHMLPTGKDTKPHSVISKQVAESVTASALASLDGITKRTEADGDTTDTKGRKRASSNTTPPPSPRNHRHHHSRQVLTELIDEVQLDTTPSAKGVQQILGGPFSFIGQYPTEGVILMKRADQLEDVDRDLKGLSIKQLKALCMDNPDIDFDDEQENTTVEEADLVEALRGAQLPINPHKLQPPFDKEVIRGDILVLKVADADNDDDDNEEEDENPQAAMAKAMAEFHAMTDVSNDAFFLNYTKDEWVKFAMRTDVVAPMIEAADDDDDDEEENSNDDDDDDDDEEADGDDDDDEEDYEVGIDDLDEKEKPALLNLILGELLKKFRKEHGRGPDSEELLEIRRQVAERLGVHLEDSSVPRQLPGEESDDDKHEPSPKRVKFSGGDEDEAGEGHDPDGADDDSKPAASTSSKGEGDKKFAAAE